jgi:hypothetical protein
MNPAAPARLAIRRASTPRFEDLFKKHFSGQMLIAKDLIEF